MMVFNEYTKLFPFANHLLLLRFFEDAENCPDTRAMAE